MNAGQVTLLVALLGALGTGVGGLAAYLVARRRSSGKVDTSDAATLWTESTNIRQELRHEVEGLRKDLQATTKELGSVRAELSEMRTELAGLRLRLARYEHDGDTAT